MRQFILALPRFLYFLAFAATAGAQTLTNNLTTSTLLAKAEADECWAGLGANKAFNFPPCGPPDTPKVNSGYIWSMVDVGDEVWFGTVANPHCTTQGSVALNDTGLTPYKMDAFACEYSASPYSPPLPASLGDFRPPQMFVYNKTTKILTDITPKTAPTGANPRGIDELVRITAGLRAAVRTDKHVIFAGPSLGRGVSMFAFRIDAKQLVAKTSRLEYLNIRDFVTHNNVIYTGVRNLLGGGSVLRYRGFIPDIVPPAFPRELSDCPTCFIFETVGTIDNEAANLAVHAGRLYTATGPHSGMAGLWMSPAIPANGLTRSQAGGWLKVWKASGADSNQYVRGRRQFYESPDKTDASPEGG
jgi:hypothetical protein